MSLLPPYFYFIVAGFLVSIYATRRDNAYYKALKTFPFFLLATIIAESYASYLSYKGKNNVIVYNFFTTLEFCYYLVIIGFILSNPKAKKITVIAAAVYGVAAVVNILFIQGLRIFHTVTYSIGSLFIVGFCIYYFLELFRYPKSVKLIKTPAFWLCSGLLFFYCCSFPLYALIHVWMTVPLILDNFLDIVAILNIFLYTMFIIAFLCNRPRKYTLSSS